jgi:2-dehydropantoate 2-reductase
MQGCQQYSSGLKVADSQLNPSQRIYILGIGNIGKLFSHALATKPQPPPISLLLHRETLLDAWAEAGRAVEIVTDGVSNRNGMFDVELINKVDETRTRLPDSIIENLIVSTKTTNTATALSSIRHRLGPGSTILFAQNGMGTVEEVSKVVFPHPETRPRYLACVTSHGIFSQGPFSSVHAGKGTIAIGDVQGGEKEAAYITQQMIQSPVLTAREVSSSELKLLQLEKLVINAMMNPLTAIFDRRNGELFSSLSISRLMSLLLSEVSDVIRALPELQQDPSIQDRFSMKRLHSIVLNVAEITAKNTSSMLQDVRAGRPTEIDYINGYIAQRGAELGIDCNNNERLSDMVRQTRVITESEIGQYFPDYI